jgi:hypothetical protein
MQGGYRHASPGLREVHSIPFIHLFVRKNRPASLRVDSNVLSLGTDRANSQNTDIKTFASSHGRLCMRTRIYPGAKAGAVNGGKGWLLLKKDF